MTQRPGPFTAVADHVHVSAVPFDDADGAGEVNVGLVVGTEAALLVDAGATPAQGLLLRAEVAAVTSLPVVALVLTHAHHDHAFGAVGVGAGLFLIARAAGVG